MNAKKIRLDQALSLRRKLSRSQAENFIKLGLVKVNNQIVTKPSSLTNSNDKIDILEQETYVSRAGLKLASVADIFELDFNSSIVLDVGSSTGGFTDYALKHGAKKVIAIDVGTEQLHPKLRGNPKIDLREKTDIRSVSKLDDRVNFVLIDVSFISIREILDHLPKLIDKKTLVVAMVKPQFEAGQSALKHKGVIKNSSIRRDILQDFERWVKSRYKILSKQDSGVAGQKGNLEKFYLLKLI
ncbi:MAG: TlyA family RNA methyltransferase [Patescibacteria group bacterium]